MKKHLLLIAVVFCFILTGLAFAAKPKDKAGDQLLKKSRLFEPGYFNPTLNNTPANTSFPMPFQEIGNSQSAPAVSTGYYFVDSDDDAASFWRPDPEIVDTNTERTLWRRVLPGPRLRPSSYWTQNPDEGLRFFRNPADGNFFSNPSDSTTNAIAGPIPIGFAFYFNGVRYDSFYVSTTGIIALTNRRYFYDSYGNKYVPDGASTAYDPMSMDWFASGRTRSGDGTQSGALADNFGYYYSVCGGSPSTATAGIRTPGGPLNAILNTGTPVFPDANKSAIIAPFFGSLMLSQFNSTSNMPDDFGQVWYKRSNAGDKLIIYYVNITPVGIMATTYGPYLATANIRPGDANFVSASAQIVLNRNDSSVTINYGAFIGNAIVASRPVPSKTIFRYNTTCGLKGFARHVNYPSTPASTATNYPWSAEYEQFTHYWNTLQIDTTYPHDYLSVRFKQWKNVLRVVDIQYRVRPQNPSGSTCFNQSISSSSANNYELLAGDNRLGAIQPVAILQNLTNDIQGPQGVNYVTQDLNFRGRFKVINQATTRIIYNRLIAIDSNNLRATISATDDCNGTPYVRNATVTKTGSNYTATTASMTGLNGIPTYGFAAIYFEPFQPNEYSPGNIGRMQSYIIGEPFAPANGESLGDQWPFDDTTSIRFFVMKRLSSFKDDVTHYHVITNNSQIVPMPSTLMWVNIDAQVVSGDDVSKYPLPPRGPYAATNNSDFGFTTPDFTQNIYYSPVIRMDRVDLAGNEPAASPGGDEIRSFPIDMTGRINAVLSLAVQRMYKLNDYSRDWSDNQLVAPEPRSIINADPFRVWTQYSYAASYHSGDLIAVDFAKPSPDGVSGITNIPDNNWKWHPMRNSSNVVSNMYAYAIYGAGGLIRGYLENDKDSVLTIPVSPNLNGLRPDIYDDGIDWEYQKVFITIPDTFINAPNNGAYNFRFRIKVFAYNDKKCQACIPDDQDPFFVDNIRIIFQDNNTEETDIEVTKVEAQWPYTIAPISQSIAIPIRVKISNNTSLSARPFTVKVRIFRWGEENNPKRAIYCRTTAIPFMLPSQTMNVIMPNWDARYAGSGTYKLIANIIYPGGDLDPTNDTTYTQFVLTLDSVFAYDPLIPHNDVPLQQFSNLPGKGLSLYGYVNYGGPGGPYGPGGYDELNGGSGVVGGSGSGEFAMKFKLSQQDTIKGIKAYFGSNNAAFDDIELAIYSDAGNPSDTIANTVIYRQRAWDDVTNTPIYDSYVTYKLNTPVILPAGTYWASIAQLAQTGLELGASKNRSGMRVTSIYIPPPYDQGGTAPNTGVGGYHLNLDKTFRKLNVNQDLINDNFFAFENSFRSGQWNQFTPTIGNPAFAHLHHFGTSPQDGMTATLSRGSWVPMIRPYLSYRHYTTDNIYNPCPEDTASPVQLVSFNGIARNNSVNLYWETASEVNITGFYVEKSVFDPLNPDNSNWEQVKLVSAYQNGSSDNNYTYNDYNVSYKKTYNYRLRAVDKNGEQACDAFANIVTVTIDQNVDVTLMQNSPNPFLNTTSIKFILPETANTKLDILDVYGNVVKVLVNSELSSDQYTYPWDGTDANNNKVSTGTYIYRLMVGDRVFTGKMTFLR